MAASIIASGCSGGGKQEHANVHHAANGDLREHTESLQVLPAFLDSASEQVRLAYSVAAGVSDTLSSIPCYCGCGDSAGHRSNLNCFIQDIQPDGTVVWDDHGTRCGVCIQIALTTAEMKSQGKSAKEIRTIIDQAYAEGYAKPTPTPMPEA
ncbi:PCYCGC motif-containing (lipo)protein [Paenibacillus silvisoli]|uniref:PCYCGC motif-containing (lipo)protein n=1 Tax=Paenibacillus silvisoli TaxID=3110539 RepID=UPI002803CB30|nr:PCYCGC motif-containing (lipo)protein [Paenibacillus silvisoli]